MFKPLYYWITGKQLKNVEEKKQKCEKEGLKENLNLDEDAVELVTTSGTDSLR